MGLNFPAAPLVGDVYPVPALPGVPQWTWNGVSWKCGTIDTANYIRKSGDAMTGPLVLAADPAADMQAATRRYADAMAADNLLINGFMDVSQEFGFNTSQASPNGTYIADQWMVYGNTGFTTSNNGLGGGGVDPPGIYRMIGLVSPAGYAPVATHVAYFVQPIEGLRFAKVGWGISPGIPVSVGFWVYSNVGGVMTVAMRDWNPASRSYCIPITIPATQWVYRTATFPPCPDGANWKIDNNASGTLFFTFMPTTSLIAPAANSWQSGNYICAPTQTNMFTAGSQGNYVTGVTLMPGNMPVPQALCQYMRRDPAQERLLCRRYFFYETYEAGHIWAHPIDLSNNFRRCSYRYNPEMRMAPVLTLAAANTGAAPTADHNSQFGADLVLDVASNTYSYLTSIKATARF